MSLIKELLDQVTPVMEAARLDPQLIPNIQVVELMTERLHHHYGFTRVQATQLAFAMTIEVGDASDVNAAVCILEQGFELLLALAKKLTRSEEPGHLFGPMLEACRALSVEG
tara:strand:- start:181 stop:516 length:336 start_codon:yes stop_codon:yes gene_type:complete